VVTRGLVEDAALIVVRLVLARIIVLALGGAVVTAVECVLPRAAVHVIGSVAAVHVVVAIAAVERIVAGVAVERIVVVAAVEVVVALSAVEAVVAGVAEEVVRALAARQGVVAIAAVHFARRRDAAVRVVDAQDVVPAAAVDDEPLHPRGAVGQ